MLGADESVSVGFADGEGVEMDWVAGAGGGAGCGVVAG